MQQPLSQHDQMAAQQMQQQQMVLCPVRVVYETQILVQPGDQIQPNQTLFINPQNPPPWAQSRPVQNPVIYVQQMPGNIVPSLPQHMDQNQLFLQQYPGYQQGVQVIPQQMVQNVQENRQNAIQMPNLIHQNMLPNFQTSMPSNINQNIQTLPDRTIQQSYQQIHPGTNMQIQQPQINLASNTIINRPNETITSMQNQVQQNQFNAPKVEMKPTYMHVGQMTQSPNIGRPQPQVLTVNPIQNLPQTNLQTFTHNITRPIKTESVASQITPPTYVNAAQNTHITRIRKVLPTNTMNKPNSPNVVKSSPQTQYRHIQPRPIPQATPLHSFRPSEPSQILPNSMSILNQNVININSSIPSQNINTNTVTFIKSEDLNSNRKRKSESPDEIHKKMAAIQVNITTPIKQVTDIAKRSSEIGINTSPLPKSEVTITPSILQPNHIKINITTPTNNELQSAEARHIANIINAVRAEQSNALPPNPSLKDAQTEGLQQKEAILNADKDKLIRNTVFTQARGRVLTDKETQNILKEGALPDSIQILKDITITPKGQAIATNASVKQELDVKPLQETNLIKQEQSIQVKEEKKEATEVKAEVKNEGKKEIKVEKKETAHMNVSLNTTNNKGMFPMDRTVKQEKDYILTHVLDGIVIQESNVAFPIREPLIKRISQSTAQMNLEAKSVKQEKSIEKVPAKDMPKLEDKPIVKDIPKVEEASNSQNTEKSVSEGVTQGDNPFQSLTSATVKSWTVHQLSSHLSTLGWQDTASLFVEHEIDGESLYLVSKAQLQTIGVKENQADVICAFVKS